jgi:RES domain-containing protein
VYRTVYGPLHFDTSKSYRFNAPDGAYGTCYFGITDDASFVETLLRGEPPTRLVTMTELRLRRMAQVRVAGALQLVPVRDQYLNGLGVTADISSSQTYERSQLFARALWAHPDQPDGIEYRCRHDNSLMAIALFDRAQDRIEATATEPLDNDVARLLKWRDRWKFRLAP